MFTPFTDVLEDLPREDLLTMSKMLKLVMAVLSCEPHMLEHVTSALSEMVEVSDSDDEILQITAKVVIDYNELVKRLNNDVNGRISRRN